MRWGAFAMVAIVAACGRIGFDPFGDGGSSGDDGGDGGGPMGTISNPTALPGEQFAHQVVISADGRTIAVSARSADATVVDGGVAYVFVASGDLWVLDATLEPAVRDVNDQFGLSLAISADGSTVVVTATNEDGGGTDTMGDPNSDAVMDSGAAWVFARSGGSWAQQAYLKSGISSPGDLFGSCAALSADGNVLVVGERKEDAGATDSGAVDIFRRAGTVWTFDRKLAAVPLRANDDLGTACGISSDGTTIAAAAASYMNDTGAVIVFHDEGAFWAQTLIVPTSVAPSDAVGDGMVLSPAGTVVAAGASGYDTTDTNTGVVFVFALEGATWTESAFLMASDAQAEDTLGFNLAIARGGDEILVAAEGADRGGAADSGSVYTFEKNGTTWTSTQRSPPAPVANQVFGDSIAASADGSVIAIGAPGDDSGRGLVYVFRN